MNVRYPSKLNSFCLAELIKFKFIASVNDVHINVHFILDDNVFLSLFFTLSTIYMWSVIPPKNQILLKRITGKGLFIKTGHYMQHYTFLIKLFSKKTKRMQRNICNYEI